MQVLIDYLTLTTKVHSERFFLNALGLVDCPFMEMPGRFGWVFRLYYRGVSVYYGGTRDDVCLEISGTGCRTVEEASDNTFDWLGFLSSLEGEIYKKEVHVSRLDIAGDDKDGTLLFSRLVPHCKHHRYICKARWRIWMDGDEQSIYFGSPQSDRRVRIYNKAKEQGLEDTHWMRCEMQMRNDNATSFLLNWFQHKDVGLCYAGILLDFLRFTTKAPDGIHYDRCVTIAWWEQFVHALRKCRQLYLDGGNYTMLNVQRFLERQASSSLKLWLEVNSGDITDIVAMIEGATLNHRQAQLLERIRLEEAERTNKK